MIAQDKEEIIQKIEAMIKINREETEKIKEVRCIFEVYKVNKKSEENLELNKDIEVNIEELK